MITLYDADNDNRIGEITEPQLEVLIEELVEESLDEFTWNLTGPVIDSLETAGAEPALIGLLRRALGSRSSMELRYDPD
ncbi:MAG: hypothetical protein ACRD5D_00285 [Candidatus Polarisedimenticolia bacterium]